MIKNIKLKELPKGIVFATFNSQTKEIILGEYIIATLIFNGESFNKILKSANEIENNKEREDVKAIITKIILDLVDLNPEFEIILEQNNKEHLFLDSGT